MCGCSKFLHPMSLESARDKLINHNFDLGALPNDRYDNVWSLFLNPPYNLNVQELSLLKNDKLPPTAGKSH